MLPEVQLCVQKKSPWLLRLHKDETTKSFIIPHCCDSFFLALSLLFLSPQTLVFSCPRCNGTVSFFDVGNVFINKEHQKLTEPFLVKYSD